MIRIAPPLVIDQQQLDWALDRIESVLRREDVGRETDQLAAEPASVA